MTTQYQSNIDPQEREKRKRYLHATIISCIAAAMVFGVMHVVKLGSNRMDDMRDRATYDLSEMEDHIRAAGEDITRHREHEMKKQAERTYAWNELEALLTAEQWEEVNQTILIPEGPFLMGTDSERSDKYNQPQHTINLPAYLIDKYPVTHAEYAKFIVSTKRRPPLDWTDGTIPDGKYLYPVTMVSWYDARDYCAWEEKRLPTEAEWEKAARGTDGRRWPWGNQMDPEKLNTYYHVGSSTVVMKYENGISPYGVFDMAGNVSEWTASDFEPYQGSKASMDAFRPKKLEATSPVDKNMNVADLVQTEGVYKVRRGGSWKSDPFSTSSYHRNFSMPYYASDFFGFRCAADVNQAGVSK